MPGGGQVNEIVHPMRVTRVRFSPDGSWLLTACDDGQGRAWTAREK
jgi:WD40 repeat protein